MKFEEFIKHLDDISLSIYEESDEPQENGLKLKPLAESVYLIHDWDEERGDIHSLETESWYEALRNRPVLQHVGDENSQMILLAKTEEKPVKKESLFRMIKNLGDGEVLSVEL